MLMREHRDCLQAFQDPRLRGGLNSANLYTYVYDSIKLSVQHAVFFVLKILASLWLKF